MPQRTARARNGASAGVARGGRNGANDELAVRGHGDVGGLREVRRQQCGPSAGHQLRREVALGPAPAREIVRPQRVASNAPETEKP
eukprot:11126044-Lingulodinium_polyedra.AAC.1